MRKQRMIALLFVAILTCLLCAGCTNASAKAAYDNDERIASIWNSYSTTNSYLSRSKSGCAYTSGSFAGLIDVWTCKTDSEQSIDVDITFTLQEGTAKLVMVDGDRNVTTLMECTPDTATTETVTQSITLQPGKTRFRLVGYDCKKLELHMGLTDGKEK